MIFSSTFQAIPAKFSRKFTMRMPNFNTHAYLWYLILIYWTLHIKDSLQHIFKVLLRYFEQYVHLTILTTKFTGYLTVIDENDANNIQAVAGIF